MKKLSLVLFIIAICVGFVSAKNNYSRDVSVLPQAAQSIIKKNFKAKVEIVKIDKDFGRISEYEVKLSDGSEITFDRNGNWKDVETGIDNRVPDAFIPANTRKFIKANHNGQHVVGIDKDRNGYEITLTNGIDFKTDKEGRFLRYD